MRTVPDNFRDVLKIDLSEMHSPDQLVTTLRTMADTFERRGWKDYEGSTEFGSWTIYAEPRDAVTP